MYGSRSAEGRAQGAAMVLGFYKKMNVPIDTEQNTAQSKLMRDAMNIGIRGTMGVQNQMLTRMFNSSIRAGGMATGAVSELAGRGGLAPATAMWENEFKPESSHIGTTAQSDITSITKTFDSALATSEVALLSFAESISTSKDLWMAAIKEEIETKKRVGATINDNDDRFYKTNKQPTQSLTQNNQDSGFTRTMMAAKPYIIGGAAALGTWCSFWIRQKNTWGLVSSR